jgi:hypothetical protein
LPQFPQRGGGVVPFIARSAPCMRYGVSRFLDTRWRRAKEKAAEAA